MTDNNAATPQPSPVEGKDSEIIIFSVLESLSKVDCNKLGYSPNLLDLISIDLTERAKIGKVKYGTYLKTLNGRDSLTDLYQELLDALMYGKQADLEIDALTRGLYTDILSLCMYCRSLLKLRDGE